MKSKRTYSMQFFVPGIFLLLLGVGNIWVGTYKCHQYEQLYIEVSRLANDQTATVLMNASPLRRIQLSRRSQERVLQLQKKSQDRQNFYQLFIAGGSLFVGLSSFLFFITLITHLRSIKTLTPSTS